MKRDRSARVRQIFIEREGFIDNSHLVYASDRHGTQYLDKSEVFLWSRPTLELGEYIAEECLDLNIEGVIGPATGAIGLALSTAHFLTAMTGREVMWVYAERQEDSLVKIRVGGKAQQIVVQCGVRTDPIGLELAPGDELLVKRPSFVVKRNFATRIKGKRMLAVEDVVNTGASLRETSLAAQRCEAILVACVVLCNRGGVTAEQVSAPSLDALWTVDMEAKTEAECAATGPCSRGVPINEKVGKGKAYMDRKRAEQK